MDVVSTGHRRIWVRLGAWDQVYGRTAKRQHIEVYWSFGCMFEQQRLEG